MVPFSTYFLNKFYFIQINDCFIDFIEPLKVIEVSHSIVQNNKETVWLLLSKPVVNLYIFVDIGDRMLPVERLKIYGKVLLSLS